MITMSMNSENNKTSNLYKLVLNLTHKMDLQRGDKRVVSSDLSVYKYKWKNIKTPHGNKIQFELS